MQLSPRSLRSTRRVQGRVDVDFEEHRLKGASDPPLSCARPEAAHHDGAVHRITGGFNEDTDARIDGLRSSHLAVFDQTVTNSFLHLVVKSPKHAALGLRLVADITADRQRPFS